MANKYVALLVVVCLVVAGAVEAQPVPQRTIHPGVMNPQECFNDCYNTCVWPATICRWKCAAHCKYVVGLGSVDSNASRKIRGPTEKNISPVSAVTPRNGNYHLE